MHENAVSNLGLSFCSMNSDTRNRIIVFARRLCLITSIVEAYRLSGWKVLINKCVIFFIFFLLVRRPRSTVFLPYQIVENYYPLPLRRRHSLHFLCADSNVYTHFYFIYHRSPVNRFSSTHYRRCHGSKSDMVHRRRHSRRPFRVAAQLAQPARLPYLNAPRRLDWLPRRPQWPHRPRRRSRSRLLANKDIMNAFYMQLLLFIYNP